MALSEKSGGKRASTFGSVRAMWPRRYELAGTFDFPYLPSTSVSEAEEGGPFGKMRRVTGDSFASSASEASESDVGEKKFSSPSSMEQSQIFEKPKVDEAVASPGPGPSPTEEPEMEELLDRSEKKTGSDSDSTIGAKEGASPPKADTDVPVSNVVSCST